MTNVKALKLWIVNMVSFLLFVMLGVSGLINWVILPKGYAAQKGGLVGLRHFLVEVHEWTALLFMTTIAIHILLNWTYVRNNFKKYGMSE